MASLNITLPLRSAPTETTTVIHDPFGFGYEGRVGVSRELSRQRAGIAAVLSEYASRSKQAPDSVQYQYLLANGFYTTEELKDHPGRPPSKNEALEAASTEDESNNVAEEMRNREQNEYAAKKGEERWKAREARMRRWRGSWKAPEDDQCRCPYCLNRGGSQHPTEW